MIAMKITSEKPMQKLIAILLISGALAVVQAQEIADEIEDEVVDNEDEE